MENQAENQPVELTSEMVLAALKGFFGALEDAFETEEHSGTVQAYDMITNLRDLVVEKPEMIKFLFTGENLARFKNLQARTGGDIGPADFIQAFPEVLQALNPMNFFSK